MIQDTSSVVVKQVFSNSVTQVWQAITQLDQMKQWFFENIPEFSRESCQAGWNYFIKEQLKAFLDKQ